MATNGFFSEGISGNVLKQIQVRQEKFGKSLKTAEELAVIHENTAWAVLRAGIMTPVNDADRFKVFKTQDELPVVSTADAQNAVLGGELQTVNIAEDGTTSRVRPSGIQTVKSRNFGPAYRITTYQGHRPVSGITSVSVKTLDTWGMIMEATVNIKVWSKDELEDLDRVYFKPGFPALLEWGHSLYFENDGSICKEPRLMVSDAEFFRNSKVGFTYLDEEILKRRLKTCNQEACFGYITNFSYSFQKNGSYDCTVKILSKGAVLKSLQLKGGFSEIKEGEQEEQNDSTYSNRSIFHAIHRAFDQYAQFSAQSEGNVETLNSETSKYTEIENLRRLPPRKGGTVTNVFSGKQAILNYAGQLSDMQRQHIEEKLQDFPVIWVPIEVSKGILWWKTVESVGEYYITLRSLLYLFNFFNSANGLISFDLWSTARYVKTPDMASLDPYVVIVPSQNTGHVWHRNPKVGRDANGNYTETSDTEDTIDFNPPVSGTPFRDLIGWEEGTVDVNGTTTYLSDYDGNKILNLWINFGQFVQDVEQELQNTDNYSIKSIIERLLARVQKALGNLSLFQLISNQLEGGSLYEIVDVKCIYNSTKPGEINITGLENTVSNLTIQSDVSPDLANSMCIAAQAPKNYEEGFGSEDQTMVHWGENCQPLWVTADFNTGTGVNRDGDNSKEKKEKSFEEEQIDWYRHLGKAYAEFRKPGRIKAQDSGSLGGETVQAVSEEKFGDLQLQGEKFRRAEAQQCVYDNSYRENNLEMGIIPIRIGFTMLGIGRITVGTTFRVRSGVLPKKYDEWGYIVTGIDHNIGKSGWTTTLKTQYYPVYWRDKEAGKTEILSDWEQGRSEQISGQINQGQVGTGKGEYRPQTEENKKKIDAETSLYKAFTQCSGFDWGGSHSLHYCAWYATGWAHAFVKGKSFLKKGTRVDHGLIGPQCVSGGHGNDATAENFRNGLPAGYIKKVVGDNKTESEIRAYARNFCRPGDILIYYCTTQTKGHAAFCLDPKLDNGWVSDFRHSSFVYGGSSLKFRLLHFKLNPVQGKINLGRGRSSDWKTIS